MSKKCYLFAYGRLQSKYDPPDTMSHHEPDEIYADLYERGRSRDPLVIDVDGEDTGIVPGELITLDESEMAELDGYETGYHRSKCRTLGGKHAYVYEWEGDLPHDSRRIQKWPSRK